MESLAVQDMTIEQFEQLFDDDDVVHDEEAAINLDAEESSEDWEWLHELLSLF